MSVVIRLKVPIEMHYTVIPMGTSKVNSSLFMQMCILLYYLANKLMMMMMNRTSVRVTKTLRRRR